MGVGWPASCRQGQEITIRLEREFWATYDSVDYLNWDKAERVIFPKLKPSTKTISLRMSESMLNELRLLANKRDVPHQSLSKVFLQERIDQELYRQAVKG